jgi:hypothetical protein
MKLSIDISFHKANKRHYYEDFRLELNDVADEADAKQRFCAWLNGLIEGQGLFINYYFDSGTAASFGSEMTSVSGRRGRFIPYHSMFEITWAVTE